MTGRKHSSEGRVRVTDAAAETAIRESLETLKVLTEAFDTGRHGTAYSMANEVAKILTSNSVAVRLRGERRFSAPYFEFSPTNIAPEMLLIGAKIDNTSEPSASFWPVFYDNCISTRRIHFREWWNRDVIYRAGAYETGSKRGKEGRDTLTRERFVTDLRNTRGAHLDLDQHAVLEKLQQSEAMGVVLEAIQPDGSILSTDDGSLRVIVGPAAAMMRQIAFEVLNAFGLEEEREPKFGQA